MAYQRVEIDKRLRKNGLRKGGFGRPPKEVDWERVDQLLEAGCLGTEIASHFDMWPETFYEKVFQKYGITFTLYSQQKKNKGDSILREVQYKKALRSDNTLLIWLGKQRLGQKENEKNDAFPPNDSQIDNDLEKTTYLARIKFLENELNELKSKTDPIIQRSEETI